MAEVARFRSLQAGEVVEVVEVAARILGLHEVEVVVEVGE